MEAVTTSGETDTEDLECWISSPSLEQFKKQLDESLAHLANTQTDDVKPRLKIYKYPQFMINVAIRHILNNNITDFIKEFKLFCPDDYEIIKQVADEIHESVSDALLEDNFTCTYVEIFDADLIAVKVKL